MPPMVRGIGARDSCDFVRLPATKRQRTTKDFGNKTPFYNVGIKAKKNL